MADRLRKIGTFAENDINLALNSAFTDDERTKLEEQPGVIASFLVTPTKTKRQITKPRDNSQPPPSAVNQSLPCGSKPTASNIRSVEYQFHPVASQIINLASVYIAHAVSGLSINRGIMAESYIEGP
jgi:hypothetical protein